MPRRAKFVQTSRACHGRSSWVIATILSLFWSCFLCAHYAVFQNGVTPTERPLSTLFQGAATLSSKICYIVSAAYLPTVNIVTNVFFFFLQNNTTNIVLKGYRHLEDDWVAITSSRLPWLFISACSHQLHALKLKLQVPKQQKKGFPAVCP